MAAKTVPAADAATLREALKEADMHCLVAQEEIEALCRATGDRIEKVDAPIAKRLLRMIEERAFTAMNSINSRAEKLGCNFIEVPRHA